MSQLPASAAIDRYANQLNAADAMYGVNRRVRRPIGRECRHEDSAKSGRETGSPIPETGTSWLPICLSDFVTECRDRLNWPASLGEGG